MATKKKTAKKNQPTDTSADAEALESFQPVALDVNSAHDTLAQLTAELRHHIDTQSPGMTGEQLRTFYARLVMAERALGDSIAPVNELTQPAIDPATDAPVDPTIIPEPAEANQATSDQT